MKEFTVTVGFLECVDYESRTKTITIHTDVDLMEGDDKAWEVVEQKCEELGGVMPVELMRWDVTDPKTGDYNHTCKDKYL